MGKLSGTVKWQKRGRTLEYKNQGTAFFMNQAEDLQKNGKRIISG